MTTSIAKHNKLIIDIIGTYSDLKPQKEQLGETFKVWEKALFDKLHNSRIPYIFIAYGFKFMFKYSMITSDQLAIEVTKLILGRRAHRVITTRKHKLFIKSMGMKSKALLQLRSELGMTFGVLKNMLLKTLYNAPQPPLVKAQCIKLMLDKRFITSDQLTIAVTKSLSYELKRDDEEIVE